MSMNDALLDEIEALTSIYDSEVLKNVDERGVLTLPNTAYSFSLSFPASYPDEPPSVLGTHHVDASAKKGEGEAAAGIVRNVLGRVYAPGLPCLFDVVEEATPLLIQHHEFSNAASQDLEEHPNHRSAFQTTTATPAFTAESSLTVAAAGTAMSKFSEPDWILSEPLIVNKSTFVARCVGIKSLRDATNSISHLLSTNKRVAGATHNISAWRIKSTPAQDGGPEIVVQDSDDDGETAAGGRLLHLMQLTDVWNVVVVVTRWYGGVKLGPERFKCINAVAREALLKGGFAVEKVKDTNTSKKGKKG